MLGQVAASLGWRDAVWPMQACPSATWAAFAPWKKPIPQDPEQQIPTRLQLRQQPPACWASGPADAGLAAAPLPRLCNASGAATSSGPLATMLTPQAPKAYLRPGQRTREWPHRKVLSGLAMRRSRGSAATWSIRSLIMSTLSTSSTTSSVVSTAY